MDKKQIERPLILEMNDAENEIFKSISEIAHRRKIPFFLLKYILLEALQQIKDGAKNEVEQANVIYKRQMEDNENG